MISQLQGALAQHIARSGGGDGIYQTSVDGLTLLRTTQLDLPYHVIYRPSLCIVAQGAKRVSLGKQAFEYHEGQALVVSLEVPALGQVTKASPESPYLAMVLEFDMRIMRDVLKELGQPSTASNGPGVFVETLGERLIGCLVRLVDLLQLPKSIPILYPAIMREICYWLLVGSNAEEMRLLAAVDGRTQRIADAILLLRGNYSRAVPIENLASAARMSLSSFHFHFKNLTAMTPLQYQKHLRLTEARRLLVEEGRKVASTAYEVGYESASQFSREYVRMFGIPPKADMYQHGGSARN
jgi:AraC-like DNA-binding protein